MLSLSLTLTIARNRATASILWGDSVHGFHQVVGVILVAVGMLWAILG